MRSLFAMLGKYTCPEVVPPGSPPGEAGFETNTKGLGGHYLDTLVDIPGVLHGRGITGWNPVDGNYFAQYADDWGSSSTATGSGWVNGHLVLTGPIIQVVSPNSTGHATGVHMTLSNDYQILGKGHYAVIQTITTPTGQTVQHKFDCRRM
jgi:hypothetical protein